MSERKHWRVALASLVAALALYSPAAPATPKAAESADAPVTKGGEAAQPVFAKPAQQQVAGKPRPPVKPKKAKPGKAKKGKTV